MYFRSVRLRDYRNFRSAEAAFSPRLNILLGENGQGKTNLIEALYLAAQGRSFRYGDNGTLIRADANEAIVDARVHRKELVHRVQLQVQRSRKAVFLNEKRVSSVETRKLFPVVLFSPESLSAVKEGADHRRELVDDFLITHHPENADLIADYKRVLKTRNRVLKHLAEGEGPRHQLVDVLESLWPRFYKLAGDLTEARLRALVALQPELLNAMKYISTKNDVDISVEMSISGQSTRDWTREKINDALSQRAEELRPAELSSGASLVGPHKHDITFLYQQKDSRFFSSQGQQRALILSFKMAQIVYHRKAHGFYPVLMLDDVLSELDAAKRKALITFLHEIKTQVFLTTTDLALSDHFLLHESAVLHISDGQIRA